ncbi:hypothetical protein J4G08_08295 [Candidatus Poribacteria bacterium]|nr:hypothetical protein [Candidatus Poribacteria bacterium]
MRITTMTQAKIVFWTATVMVVLAALIVFLTNFDGALLLIGAILLYEAVARSEPGREIFPNQTSLLPKNKVFLWIFALSGILLTVNSVLELWKFVFAA